MRYEYDRVQRRGKRKEAGTVKKLILLVALLSFASLGWAENRESSIDRLDNAGKVLHEIMAAPDNGIPEEVL